MKIFSIGDSLTAGSVGSSRGSSARAKDTFQIYMEEVIKEQFPEVELELRNFGVPGQTSHQIIRRFSSVLSADIIILMMGTNDCWIYGGNQGTIKTQIEGVINNYEKAMRMFIAEKGQKHLILCSLPLVDAKVGLSGMRDCILAINERLAEYHTPNQNVYFCNFEEKLTDGEQNLKKSFHHGDGVHLTNKALQLMGEKLARLICSEILAK